MATQKKKTTTKKTTTKGRHEVTVAIPARDLKNADLTIEVKKGGKKLGTLFISRGGLDWCPKSAHDLSSFTWEQLATVLNNASK